MDLINSLQKIVKKNSKKKAIKIPELIENSHSTEYEIVSEVTTANIQNNFYTLKEPILNEEGKKQYSIIKRGIFEIINLGIPKDTEDYVEKITRLIISETDLRMSEKTTKDIAYLIHKDFIGLGKIDPLLKDPFITEIYYDTSIKINHKLFGNLSTDIMLKEEELGLILRKLVILCKKEISSINTKVEYDNKELSILIDYNTNSINDSKFKLTKTQKDLYTPNQLIKENKLSPEILAYLWMAIEAKKNIFFTEDSLMLYPISYFLPPHVKVLTNLKNYEPNPYTITYMGEHYGEEDYAIIKDYKKEDLTANIIASSENIKEENNIICYLENGIIKSIKEDAIEVFKFSNNQFLSNLNNSKFFIAKNKTLSIKDFNLRTKLLALLFRINQNTKDYKKIIKIYYENPEIVLKKAGLL